MWPEGAGWGEKEAGRGPRSSAGGVWAGPKESAWHRTPGVCRTRAPEPRPRPRGPAPSCPRLAGAGGHARRFATRRVTEAAPGPGPSGLVREAAAGETGAAGRDAAGPPRPGRRLGPHQVTSIPSRRTRSFRGKRAPARSPGAKPPSSPSCAG